MPLEWVVNEVNATVRDWVGYFHYRNCSKAMGFEDDFNTKMRSRL